MAVAPAAAPARSAAQTSPSPAASRALALPVQLQRCGQLCKAKLGCPDAAEGGTRSCGQEKAPLLAAHTPSFGPCCL